MTEGEAHSKPEAIAQGMGITFYVARNSGGEFLPAHVVPDDCEIIATVTPPGEAQSDSENTN
jgi:hypothetical protein